jgi:hypothetical protein
MRVLLLFILSVLLLGCATTSSPPPAYQRVETGGGYGYTDQYLGDDLYIIAVRIPMNTDVVNAYEYFHRRALEILRDTEYERYEVVELQSSLDQGGTGVQNLLPVMPNPTVYGRIRCYRG